MLLSKLLGRIILFTVTLASASQVIAGSTHKTSKSSHQSQSSCEEANTLLDDAAGLSDAERLAKTNLKDPYCQYAFGVVRDRQQNYAEAMRYYRLAASQGLPFAMENIGGLYNNGWGVPVDYDLALSWYLKALASFKKQHYTDPAIYKFLNENILNTRINLAPKSANRPSECPFNWHYDGENLSGQRMCARN